MAGQKGDAIDAFERAVMGPDYRLGLYRTVPGWFDASHIARPVLAVIGPDSPTVWPGFREAYDLIREWLPQADGFVLPDATHGMQMQNPGGLAEAQAAFLEVHPLPVHARATSS
jgi:pimeloyl-ACP methyl ester carboxylesterase